jgi:hypothetical protein
MESMLIVTFPGFARPVFAGFVPPGLERKKPVSGWGLAVSQREGRQSEEG